MDHNKVIRKQRQRRRFRVRKGIKGTPSRPRLAVHRTLKHLYCQIIDDESGKTLAAASTRDKEVVGGDASGGNQDAAKAVGAAVAARATAAGIKQVCFDRGRFKYHGRVAALADADKRSGNLVLATKKTTSE